MLVLDPQNMVQVFHEQIDVRYHKEVMLLHRLPMSIRYPVHLQVPREKTKNVDAHKKRLPPPPSTSAKNAKVRAVVQALSMNFSVVSSSNSWQFFSPSDRLLYHCSNCRDKLLPLPLPLLLPVAFKFILLAFAVAISANDCAEGSRKAPIPNSIHGGGRSPTAVNSATTGPWTRAKSQPSCMREAVQPAEHSNATQRE